MTGGWSPDVLGEPYAARTLALRPDAEGEVVATLVRRGAPASRRAVLYVHGFVDYFFQTHLADAWAARGYDFYALDLRKYGRSLLPHQTPNLCLSLEEYDEELDAAARVVREEDGHDVLVVMAHSTGGLVVPLWVDRRPGPVDALVLNSPWFDLNAGLLQRTVGTRVLDVVGALDPRRRVATLPSVYGRGLHASTGGSWDYDLAWKPLDGFPVLAGWLRAVRRGHARLACGLAVDCPVLVCASTLSGPADRWSDLLTRADCVLDVEHMAARATRLGPRVTVVRVEGGIHDLALSPEPARRRFLDEVFRWASAYVPG
ncbi:alpha/beta hydrolase [Vallicoccus soli]|uniref:Alpha/beta hydrolase n=1 Tax=Vallicoccus soli TaxID=2339232 RepID=A0A3A3Z3Q1_9ACTN|nr:alpha/beta hydrolase [Vallicoccus soli]RJK98044.1 alpha/beta hydrolase [Vallicoccus soli]